MGKITYSSLSLKQDTSVKTVEFEGKNIQVTKYLPIEDKYDLCMIALQKSEENGIINNIKAEMFFNLYLVYLYTNITFTEKQRENESKLYDTLASSGLLAAVIDAMDADEYDWLLTEFENLIEKREAYNRTTAAIISKVINDMPKNAEAMANLINTFDPEKLKQIQNLATAAGYKAE